MCRINIHEYTRTVLWFFFIFFFVTSSLLPRFGWFARCRKGRWVHNQFQHFRAMIGFSYFLCRFYCLYRICYCISLCYRRRFTCCCVLNISCGWPNSRSVYSVCYMNFTLVTRSQFDVSWIFDRFRQLLKLYVEKKQLRLCVGVSVCLWINELKRHK